MIGVCSKYKLHNFMLNCNSEYAIVGVNYSEYINKEKLRCEDVIVMYFWRKRFTTFPLFLLYMLAADRRCSIL
jgi:hypothetical protein